MQEEAALLPLPWMRGGEVPPRSQVREHWGGGASGDLAPSLGVPSDLMGSLVPVSSPSPAPVSPSVKWADFLKHVFQFRPLLILEEPFSYPREKWDRVANPD